MAFPSYIWLLLITALVVSSIGFKNYVWFISLGYGFSIAVEGLLMLILYNNSLTLGTVLCCILFIIYGIRLGGYLAVREFKITSYSSSGLSQKPKPNLTYYKFTTTIIIKSSFHHATTPITKIRH